MEAFGTAVQVIRDVFAADGLAWAVTCGLTVVSFIGMRAALPVKSLATLYAPALLVGGLTGIYAFERHWITFTSDAAANKVIGATAGSMATLLAAVLTTRLLYAVSRQKSPRNSPGAPVMPARRAGDPRSRANGLD